MSGIKLDPKTLLGFKILASAESAATLRSPKIGAKGCTLIDDNWAPIVRRPPIAATIGDKV